MIYNTPHFLQSFKSTGVFVQDKKLNVVFQGGRHIQLGFPIRTVLAIFNLQVTPISFESACLSVQEKKRKINFQDGGHLRFPISTILAPFDLQNAPIFPTMFRVSWPISSGEEALNRFLRWQPWRISDLNDFSSF